MSELGPKVETNPDVAYEMAHAEEEYRRVVDLKDALGLESQESLEDGIAQVTATTREREVQRSSDRSADILVKTGRAEARQVMQAMVRKNLAANGIETNEYGNVTPSEAIDDATARKISHIIQYAQNTVIKETSPNRHKKLHDSVAVRDDFYDETDTQQVRDIVAQAVGVPLDVLNDIPYEPQGTTETGFAWSRKRVPTDLPGVFLEESAYVKGDAEMKTTVLTTDTNNPIKRAAFRP